MKRKLDDIIDQFSKKGTNTTIQSKTTNILQKNQSGRNPCKTAHQADEGLEWNFNFWMLNKALRAEVYFNQIILNIIKSNPSLEFVSKKQLIKEVSSIAIVNINCLDQSILTSYMQSEDLLNSPSFLKSTSSCPFQYPCKDDTKQKPTSDVQSSFSSLFWSKRGVISMNELNGIATTTELFSQYILHFQVGLYLLVNNIFILQV
jgi:hypothetical protein